jgi:hypothetical protein
MKKICKFCKAEYRKKPSDNIYFCSRECFSNSRKGFKKEKVSGYRLVSDKNIKRGLHRVIWENHHGRKLESNEIIHHINENIWDNRIENLQIMSRSEHAKLHKRLQIQRILLKKTMETVKKSLKLRPNRY